MCLSIFPLPYPWYDITTICTCTREYWFDFWPHSQTVHPQHIYHSRICGPRVSTGTTHVNVRDAQTRDPDISRPEKAPVHRFCNRGWYQSKAPVHRFCNRIYAGGALVGNQVKKSEQTFQVLTFSCTHTTHLHSHNCLIGFTFLRFWLCFDREMSRKFKKNQNQIFKEQASEFVKLKASLENISYA